jgi:myo-inositol-1(or 4)-monophosphatase
VKTEVVASTLPDLSHELAVASQLARQAGAVLRAMASSFTVSYKSAEQPVTEADLEADRIIAVGLRAAFPHDGLLSEEHADSAARLQQRRVWIVDPIDGTSNYARGGDAHAVSIGLAIDGVAVLGVVYNPAREEFFAGFVGGGVTLNGAAVTCSNHEDIASAKLAVSASEWRAGLAAISTLLPLYPISSIAYKLARVAAGLDDGCFTANARSEWDACAGAALVTAAGGTVSLRDGVALPFNQAEPRFSWGIVAAGPLLYPQLMQKLLDLPTTNWAASKREG